MTDFWNKVLKCKHKNLSPDYCVHIACWTPCCSGRETHCLDCGAYITDCGCGSESGMSGWPHERWRRWTKIKMGRNKRNNTKKERV